MRNLIFCFFVCGIAPLWFLGCVSLMEKTGKALDRSAFAEKRIAVYRTANMELREVQNKAGERSVCISLKKFPAILIRGSAPNEQGAFFLTSLDYLSGNSHGWNEYRLDISGYGKLTLNEKTATLSIPDEIEFVQISAGRIRRYDTRIVGNDALTYLRNRRERVIVLAEWMGTNETAVKGASKESFERYWKPLLFPELAAKKKRPRDWQKEGDPWVRADDIRWNSGYTERTFPEELRAIRNSGTMLRDWEEALEWIYVEYEWSRITELLAQETVLNKAKK